MRRVVRQGSQSRIVGIFPEEHVGIIPKVHAQCRNDGIFRRRIGYQRALVHAGEQSKDRVCVKSAAVCGLLPVETARSKPVHRVFGGDLISRALLKSCCQIIQPDHDAVSVE